MSKLRGGTKGSHPNFEAEPIDYRTSRRNPRDSFPNLTHANFQPSSEKKSEPSGDESPWCGDVHGLHGRQAVPGRAGAGTVLFGRVG